MEIIRLPLGSLNTNCYILDTNKKNAIVIDPGYGCSKITDILKEKGLELKKILLTHAHYDHIGSLYQLKKETGAKIYLHELEKDLLEDTGKNLSDTFGDFEYIPTCGDVFLKDGDSISLDDIYFKIIHTPGHTQGGVVYVDNNNRLMFTGDTLFKGYVGRSDLYGGDHDKLVESVPKILSMPDDYKIYGGHEEPTTVLHEKSNNAYAIRILTNRV